MENTHEKHIEVIMLGHRKHAGKDTLANFLVQNDGYVRLAFADKLKLIVADLFGFDDEQLNGRLKEVIDPRYGKSPRQIFQQFGTECARSVYEYVWSEYVFRKLIPEYIEKGHTKFVISDFRFKNEFKVGKKWASDHPHQVVLKTVRIDRPSLPPITDCHSSELDLLDFDSWNMVVINDGTPEQLIEKFNMINGNYDLALMMRELYNQKGQSFEIENQKFVINGKEKVGLRLKDVIDGIQN